MKNKDMMQLSYEQLQEEIKNARHVKFSLRLNAATTHVKDYSQYGKLRKKIARILTHMKQRENKQNLT